MTLFNKSTEEYKNKEFVEEILSDCFTPRSKSSIASHFGYSEEKSTYFYNSYVKPLVMDELLFLTIPENQRSKYQKITSNKKILDDK